MTGQPALRALVVDDVALVCRATMRALEQEGFACEAAADGREALQKVQTQKYDAVVTDLRMPQVNGHQLCIELLNMPQPPVVIVLTGVDEPRLVKDLIRRGVDEVMTKPVEYGVLAGRVAALVHRRNGGATTASHDTEPLQQQEWAAQLNSAPQREPDLATAVATKVETVLESLKIPPAKFDAFQEASESSLTASDLTKAILMKPEVGTEVIQLTNSLLFASTEKISALERVVADLRRSLSFGRIAAMTMGPFVAGLVLGWLLAVLTPN